MIRVLIVDDHAVVRAGLRMLLDAEPDMEVVGEAGSIDQAVFEARVLKPDVILMDVVMPGRSGIEGSPAVLHEAPDARLLVLSMQDDPTYVREAFAAGRPAIATDAVPAAVDSPFAAIVPSGDTDTLERTIHEWWDSDLPEALASRIATEFRPRTWGDAAAELVADLVRPAN